MAEFTISFNSEFNSLSEPPSFWAKTNNSVLNLIYESDWTLIDLIETIKTPLYLQKLKLIVVKLRRKFIP